MCGLIAACDPAGLDPAPLLAGLADLRHRGPDAAAHEFLDDGRLFLGHTRLKIIDLSDLANQPMTSACGTYTVVFNGEIYNYRDLRRQIGEAWPWRTRSDTEVLLAAYAREGPACLDRLDGMFAFCLYDRARRRLFGARDRFGIKPLYYLRRGAGWVFASEIPPLLRQLDRVVEDRRSIRTYLETGLYDFGPHTFFRDVIALEPGCRFEIDLADGAMRRERWYHLARHVPDLSGLDEPALVAETARRVDAAIDSHLVADVAVGLNVSGGVDSSLLVRTALVHLGHAHLFTQDYEGYSEAAWVREIAAGGTLHLQPLTRAAIEAVLPQTVRAQAEPFGGVTVCGYDYVYRAAQAQDVTVLLDGNGVDEAFLGYKKYHQHYVRLADGSAAHAERAADYQHFWGEPAPTGPGAGGAALAIDGTVPVLAEAIAPALRSSAEPYAVPAVRDFADPVKNAAATDLLFAKIPRGLRFNDRVSMARSRELRVPYLDHRLVEFAFGIPTRHLLNRRGTKAIFRRAAAQVMPAHVAFAAKRSVQSPQREWLAEGWQAMIEAVIGSESFAARGWIDADAARAAYRRYRAGNRDNSFFVWQWLNLELWARAFLDRPLDRPAPDHVLPSRVAI